MLTDQDIKTYLSQTNSIIQEKETILLRQTSEADRIRKEMNELVSMRLSGEISKDSFPRHYKPIEEQLAQIENQLPELMAEVDFLKIQILSSDTILRDAKDLYDRWPQMPFHEKRTIIEVITENITVGHEDIAIKLAYIPSILGKPGNKQRNLIPALGNCEIVVSDKMPLPEKYPNALITIADHLRKRRFDLKLSQPQVAKIIGVSTDTITYWENKRSAPQIQYYGKIIEFLGYNPYQFEIKTFGDKIKRYRHLNGLSQKALGRIIRIDPSTIKSLEENKSNFQKESQKKILNYFKTIL